MIERILDKYYLKKFKQYIQSWSLKWYLDTRFIKKNNYIEFQVKKPKYKDEMYTTIYSFYKYYGLYYFTNFNEFTKEIEKKLNKYLESQA